MTKSPAEVVDDLTVTFRCRGPSEEPRDVDDLVDHLVGNKLNDRPGPEVEGHWEGKPPVGKVVADYVVPAASQAGGQGAHHLLVVALPQTLPTLLRALTEILP